MKHTAKESIEILSSIFPNSSFSLCDEIYWSHEIGACIDFVGLPASSREVVINERAQALAEHEDIQSTPNKMMKHVHWVDAKDACIGDVIREVAHIAIRENSLEVLLGFDGEGSKKGVALNISQMFGQRVLSPTLEQQKEIASLCDGGMDFKEAFSKVKNSESE